MSVFILALTFFSTNINCDTMQEVRDDFHQIDTEDLLKTFLKKHENSSRSEATPYVQLPSFLGYYSSIQADCDFVKDNISTSGLPQNFQETVLAEINLILKDL